MFPVNGDDFSPISYVLNVLKVCFGYTVEQGFGILNDGTFD